MINEIKHTYQRMSKLEKIGTIIFIITLLGIQVKTDSSIISFICTFLGIFYVLGVKYQTRYSLLVGTIQTLTYALLALNNAVYGDFILNTYSCITLFTGYILWSKNTSDTLEIKTLNKSGIIKTVIGVIVLYLTMYYVLTLLGGYRPYLDSFNSTMSMTALYLTMLKQRSAWVFWNLNNISSLVLYLVLCLDGASVAPMVLLFTAYTINSLHAASIWYKK